MTGVPYTFATQSGDVPASELDANFQYVAGSAGYATIAALQAGTIPATLQTVSVNGYYSAGDGGAGLWKRSGTSGPGTGYVQSADGAWWVFVTSTINLKQLGALCNGTEESATINAILAFAATFGSAIVYAPAGSTIKCNSGLTLDTNKVSFIGLGATLDFTGMTSGSAISIINSNGNVNVRNALNGLHPIQGWYCKGPGSTVSAVTLFNINDPNNTTATVSRVAIKECSAINFANDIYLGQGSFCCSFEDLNFTILDGGTPTTYSVNNPSGTQNSGERSTFTRVMWNNRPLIYNQANGNADTYFEACSFDDLIGRAITISSGVCTFTDCHFEGDGDTDNWVFIASNANAAITVKGGAVVIQTSKANYSPFYVSAGTSNGGLNIKDILLAVNATQSVPLVGGPGRLTVGTFNNFANTNPMLIGAGANLMAYGDFSSASWANDWTLGGSTPPVRSNSFAPSGDTFSMKFVGGGSSIESEATRNFPAKPGQFVVVQLQYFTTGLAGSGGTFFIQAGWTDVSGAYITNTNDVSITTDPSGFTLATLYTEAPAPIGTAGFKLFIDIFPTSGSITGTPAAYVGAVTANIW